MLKSYPKLRFKHVVAGVAREGQLLGARLGRWQQLTAPLVNIPRLLIILIVAAVLLFHAANDDLHLAEASDRRPGSGRHKLQEHVNVFNAEARQQLPQPRDHGRVLIIPSAVRCRRLQCGNIEATVPLDYLLQVKGRKQSQGGALTQAQEASLEKFAAPGTQLPRHTAVNVGSSIAIADNRS